MTWAFRAPTLGTTSVEEAMVAVLAMGCTLFPGNYGKLLSMSIYNYIYIFILRNRS
jgi:hypothetical protein